MIKSTEGSRNWARHLVYVVSVPSLVVGSLLYRLWVCVNFKIVRMDPVLVL